MRRALTMALALPLLFAVGCDNNGTMARDEPVVAVPRAERLSAQEFVDRAASSDLFEIRSAELAMQKTDATPETREVAEVLAREHSESSERFQQIARENNLRVPQQMLPRHRELYQELEGLEGEQFNQRFREIQILAHQEAIELYESAARDVQVPELRQFAQQTLPNLREHREMILDQTELAEPTP